MYEICVNVICINQTPALSTRKLVPMKISLDEFHYIILSLKWPSHAVFM